MTSQRKRIAILGSTGSIGTQSLDVARWRGYDVVGLATGRSADALIKQANEFKPKLVSCHPDVAAQVKPHLPEGTSLATGGAGAEEVAVLEVDTVVAAISGIAGLKPTLAALRAGRHVALANKEAMVVAGPLVWEAARRHGATITPVDSEHSALFQCLVGERREDVDKLILTASGGPFRTEPADLTDVTPEQALKHPNWAMGAKVTVDSATLFNKGLEVLEAHFLFEMALEKIEVIIHPQSLVHSFVRFKDGNLKAQVGPHDMRLPIQYGVEYPERPSIPLDPLPLSGTWEFYEPDSARFPSLGLAYEAGRRGGTAPTILNAADELAVVTFLRGEVGFTEIPEILEHALKQTPVTELSWDAIGAADEEARETVRAYLERRVSPKS